MDILKIGCIITAVFCLHAESQDCSSTYTCPGTRGDGLPKQIECDELCDFISDCSDANGADEAQCGTLCTFEYGTCNWENISSDGYTWALGNGELLTDQSHLGPAQDKSAGNITGRYFYVHEDGSGTASLAELHGPTLHNTAETCKFSFYYHFSESSAWHLQVLLKTDYSTIQIKDLGSSSTGSRLWKKKYVTVGRVGAGNVIFRASKLPNATGAVAIDYIRFDAEACALAYDDRATVCASNKWQCDDGGCIPQEKRCDFVQHCRDNSDETHPDCAYKNRCSAEVDFCNFTSPGDSVFQRVLASSVPANSNWPVTDHTFMTPEGSYFALSGSSGGTRAVFLGPAFKGTTQGEAACEMSLFYQLVGASSSVEFGFRTRYSRADNTPNRVAHSTAKVWKKKDITFKSSTDFLPLLVVNLEEGGVFATDDIIFSEGCVYAEPEDISDQCTFEDGNMPLCSWQQDNAVSLQWEVTEAIVAGRMGAIKVDHTDQDFTGHYLYLDSKEGDEGHSARLFSKLYQPGYCQMFLWYHLGGSNTNKLSVYTRTAATEGAFQFQWRESGDHGLTWNEAVIAINQTSIFQIVIEGSAGTFTTRMDHIGVDDIGFNTPCVAAGEGVTLPPVEDEDDCSDVGYSCTDGTCTLDEQGKCPMECTFDEGLCGWKNDVTAGSQWSLSESIPPFGPTSDHTSQGHYIFIDGKDIAPYQAARLVSPRWPLSNLDCKVSIWYYHFAFNYGSLALQVKPDQGITREVYILHSRKSDFNRWTRIEADIPKCLSNFQILLTAQNSYGNLQHGGFAVDDFGLTCSQPSCTPEYQCSTGGHCFTPSQKCDMVVDCCEDRTDEDQCDDYNQCSFDDDDFCIWQQDSDDEVEWTMKPEKRKRDSHMDDGIPPNDGSFIQAEFEDSMKGKKSTLHSYLISSTDDKCELRFVYFAESSTSLRVLLRHSLEEEDAEQVWTSSMSGSWQRAVVSLPSDEPFEVVFEASSVSIEGGVIGIDSTSFTPACDITDETLKAEKKGSGLTAVIIFVVGILVCSALVIVLVIVLKGRKKEYHTGESDGPTRNPEEESSMI